MNLMRRPLIMNEMGDHFTLFDDFLWYITPHQWTSLVADTTPTVAVGDAAGGIMTLYTDNTNNNEVALKTTKELFLFAANKPLVYESLIQYTEVNTNTANVAVGFADAMGADLITDNGGAAAINSSGALIYKLDGGTVWRCVCKNNGVTNDTVSTRTAGGSAYQALRIEARPVDGTNVEITYHCDDQPLRDSTGKAIKHTLAYASATEMMAGVYAKNGHTTALTVLVDYIFAAQKR